MARHRAKLKMTDRWAFWEYDQYPYVLGGVIDEAATTRRNTNRRHGGRDVAVIASYGGSAFYPFAIVTGLAGARLQADLEEMHENYYVAQKALGKVYRDKLTARLTRDGITHPNEHTRK